MGAIGLLSVGDIMDELPAPAPFPQLPIKEYRLPGLIQGFWEPRKTGDVHGDINGRNIVVKPDGRLVGICRPGRGRKRIQV